MDFLSGSLPSTIGKSRLIDSSSCRAFLSTTRACHCSAAGGTLAELAKWASLPNQAMVPLVSPRLRDLIDSVAPGDAQFVPAHVEAKDGSAFDFSLLNVLHQVSATDRAASEVVLLPGTDRIMSFRKLVLRGSAMGEHQLARDSQYRSHFLVNDRLAARIRALKFAGVEMRAPDGIS